jgi:hypothetical protein
MASRGALSRAAKCYPRAAAFDLSWILGPALNNLERVLGPALNILEQPLGIVSIARLKHFTRTAVYNRFWGPL